MPRLILLNGPPASGKSTIAGLYVERHPLAVNLDIDGLRAQIGGWKSAAEAAGLLARAMALSAARTHLAAGHDVVIPQYLARVDFIDQLGRLAGEVAADFCEVVLLDSKERALARFVERGRISLDPAHVEAQELLGRSGGLEELSAMYDRLLTIVESRPDAIIVQTADGQIEETYQRLIAALA